MAGSTRPHNRPNGRSPGGVPPRMSVALGQAPQACRGGSDFTVRRRRTPECDPNLRLDSPGGSSAGDAVSPWLRQAKGEDRPAATERHVLRVTVPGRSRAPIAGTERTGSTSQPPTGNYVTGRVN